ncbi:MAG: aminodeoxychorismate synthase component I [Pseudomonadota bacterium]
MLVSAHAPSLAELAYPGDSAVLFEALADLPWALFLDSGGRARYDLMVADPSSTLVTRGVETEIASRDGVTRSADDPFALLRAALGPRQAPARAPFAGGAVGYFAYDLGRRVERLPARARRGDDFPDMAVGIYDWAVVVDHRERRAWLAAANRDPRTAQGWDALVARLGAAGPARRRRAFRVRGPVTSNFTRADYSRAVARILDYIRAGDCYQVNLAQRFRVDCEGDGWDLYRRLREANPAPFGAFLDLPWGQVASSSPERFLELRGGVAETRPIKGTRPRAADPGRDALLRQELATSAKDRAENVMIVDLLRNDLGKSCAVGSVRVPRLFAVESYATVHHLVSTVTGNLAPGRDALDLLRGCFPGGSITGAPKLRAMQIIEELEPHRRGVYCGAIGYAGFDGDMDLNVAIRTLTVSAGEARFYAGGGIVADSNPDDEYQETLDKAAAFFSALALCRDGGAAA